MNIKEFTECVIKRYLDNGGTVHPDITLDIFRLIEQNEALRNEYENLSKSYKSVNPTIGKTIKEHFNLRNDKTITAEGKCHLITDYTRFHKK